MNIIRGINTQALPSDKIPAQVDADVSQALQHFENEMKALRVVVQSKDVLVDPDNAWTSASRIRAPYNAAIRLCLLSGKHDRAFKLFNQMKKDGIFPSAATYTVVINGLTRSLSAHANASPSDSQRSQLAERKECQRIRETYLELEKLWKQSYPQYFQTRGALRPAEAQILEKDDFHEMTDQARRNLVSQQASVREVRDHPTILTNAIGTYASFLRLIDARDELNKLFDMLFPPAVIDDLAKGLSPTASREEKVALSFGKLSEKLPLGDRTTFSAFLTVIRDAQDPDRFATVERIWTRFQKMMDLERYERLSGSGDAPAKRQADTPSRERRFVPDDVLMTDIFNRLLPPAGADASAGLKLGMKILSNGYGLDLETATDGIIRNPQFPALIEALPVEHYHRGGHGRPLAELRSSTVASAVFRLFAHDVDGYEKCVALFNYLWARSHSEKHAAGSDRKDVGGMLSDNTGFGSTLRPSNAMNVLWHLSQKGDPVGARVLLAAMRRAAGSASSNSGGMQDAKDRRDRHSRPNLRQASHDSAALDWTPSYACYDRAMHAILTAALKKPVGLTAVVVEAAKRDGDDGTYDAWAEATSLLGQWRDYVDTSSSGSASQRAPRWDAEEADQAKSRNKGFYANRDALPDGMARIQSDTIVSLFLHIARVCAKQKREEGPEIARQALRLLEQRIGLSQLVKDANQLPDVARRGTRKTAAKSHTLPQLNGVLNLALDTSQQSFAPKEDVELWKRIKKLIPASNDADEAEWSSSVREKRPMSRGTNRLLLSRDDHLELEAEAEKEEEEEDEPQDEEVKARESQRMQRLSRHVEQELDRWVRSRPSA
ncbi:Pentatricopeptide repeat [Kalmanozyma brasiliensis GHG001]|uniref:Uncharacterized protein n=1 Tax=Kalmanozyma brasiliensis (strain GHG001) TaxID=1365824 RepID=V5EXT6_KALBG|nr:Pentatricopeptide repeat [Kalmanozyma brasiliensis GHG001]EST08398.1 Pentatricopeptide repeat [Kalmanozyma brasiliensis GHG001]